MVPVAIVADEQHDDDDDRADQRGPETTAHRDGVSCRNRTSAGARRPRRWRRRRRLSSSVVADLALDRGPSDADLHVVVDLEPEPVRSVLAGDPAEDARGGDDLVTDLDRLLQRPAASRVRRRCGRIRKKYIANGISSRIPSCTMAPPPPPSGVTGSEQGGGKLRRHNGERAYRPSRGGIRSSRRTNHGTADCAIVAGMTAPHVVDRRRWLRRSGRGAGARRRRRAR